MKIQFDNLSLLKYLVILLQGLTLYSWFSVTDFFTNVDVATLHPVEETLVFLYPILSIAAIVLGWIEMTFLTSQINLFHRDKHRERMSMKRVMEEDGLDYEKFLRRVDAGIDVRDDVKMVY
jgi:hypothetical protein